MYIVMHVYLYCFLVLHCNHYVLLDDTRMYMMHAFIQ